MAQILILNDSSMGTTCYDQDHRHVGHCCSSNSSSSSSSSGTSLHNVAVPTHQIVIPNLWLQSDTNHNHNNNNTNNNNNNGVGDLMFARALRIAEESNLNNDINKSVILLLPYSSGNNNSSSNSSNSSNTSNSSSCCITDNTNKETSIFLDEAHHKDKSNNIPINDSLWLISSTNHQQPNVQFRYNPKESVNSVTMSCLSNNTSNGNNINREVENHANVDLSFNRWTYHNPNTAINLNHSHSLKYFSQPVASNSLEIADMLKSGISWQLKPHSQIPTRYVMLTNTPQKCSDDVSSNSEWNHLNLPQLQPIYANREKENEKENDKEKEKERRNNGGQEIMGENAEEHQFMLKEITVSSDTSQDRTSTAYISPPTTISTGHQVIKRYCHLNDKKYICVVCGKKYKYETNLITHAKVHTEQALECEYCHKKFGRKTNYIEHLRIHTNERPYKCRYCGKSFKQNHGWRDHERTHTNERPHVCEVCGKGFAVGHNLTVHKRIHTGEKPYACDHCDKRFRQKSAYNAHIKNVHKNEKRKINK